ncbi:unnamed protein product [Lymnaea stagnalis]|uniref:LRAT domain-containing protein n=1 Tax=Lymnaea stagnalis TaxID=6523 RepID=A0AAV2HP17_LYMST
MSTHQSRPSPREHNQRLLEELKPGDIVKFARFGGVYYHFAIYIGNEMVIHICELEDATTSRKMKKTLAASVSSSPQNKVRIAKESFWKAARDCKGKKANHERYECESFEFDEILRRAEQCLGTTDYHFLLKNCEHFVNRIKYDKEESQQSSKAKVGFGVAGAIILGLTAGVTAFAVINSRNKKEARRQSQALDLA